MRESDSEANVTARILERTGGYRLDELPAGACDLIKQCWADWLAVSLAAAQEDAPAILLQEAIERGATGPVRLPGRTERLSLNDAIMVAGTASHALDYDDGNAVMMGHPSVTLAPALFCLAQMERVSGEQVMESFLVGYETGARIGRLVSPSHYASGFHGTATIGSFAAAAAGHLLGLDPRQMQVATGLAGTQASGLQAVFGTMAKPFHAGRCSLNGAQSARLAQLGFTAPTDILGGARGFAATHSSDFAVEAALAEPDLGLHLFAGRFKFHAACQATHPAIEAARLLVKPHAVPWRDATAITIRCAPIVDQVCNIPAPKTALELKFSVRGTVAMTLLGHDTADPASFTEAVAGQAQLQALCARTSVVFDPTQARQTSTVEVTLPDGQVLTARYDEREHEMSIERQDERIREKFRALASPVLGEQRARELESAVFELDRIDSFAELAGPAAR